MKLLLLAGILADAASASGDSWSMVTANACGNLAGCKCTDTTCKDVPNQLHFVGKVKSQTECMDTCSAAGHSNCSIWLWSQSSHHCFWRLDGTWAPSQTSSVVSGCIQGSDDPAFQCIPGCGSCTTKAPAPAPVAPPATRNYTNMNGLYNLSSTPGSDITKFPTSYRDYPGQPEYFEVYSPPIVQLYSQVFWTRLPSVDLPEYIVRKFKGKDMAIVGFEMDQVMHTDKGDVSLPINVVYNHHFESTMIGNGAKFEQIEVEDPFNDPRLPPQETGHRRPNMSEAWIVVTDPQKELEANGVPSSVSFGGANGGEFRKSFHGYAPGYAQVIHSPEQMSITPMQIDTWNRDKMSLAGGPFVPGPVPRTSLAPTEGPDAIYSGLLECPVTTRLRKEIKGGAYQIKVTDTCSAPITSAPECFQAAAEVHFPSTYNLTFTSSSLPSKPPGCIASVQDDAAAPTINVVFNSAPANSSAACGAASGHPSDLVTHGTASSLVVLDLTIDGPKDTATINITGPADVWFGVGFNATQMKDSPYAIVVEPSSGASSPDATITERKLVDQGPGSALRSTVTVASHTVDTGSNTRTIVLTRQLKGATSDYYTFDPAGDTQLSFINALGSGPTLAYHQNRTAASISLLPEGGAGDSMCLCPLAPAAFGAATGTLVYTDGSEVGCCNHCQPRPRSDMMAQKNPTCDIRTYAGGQLSCHHMWSLLDADQEIPWQDQPLNYSIKFRFWYQEYNATGGSIVEPADDAKLAVAKATGTAPSHLNVQRTTWGIASPVEYDVPKCDNETMGCTCDAHNCNHTIEGTFLPSPSNIKLVAAHFHCHAPTCLSVTMYNNDTGEVICEERPIYGGQGLNTPGFDEPGYITQPPCLWGDAKFGLTEPPSMKGVTLHVVKHSNATYGHHGEMAWLQMFYVNDDE